MEFSTVMKTRRTRYDLTPASPISDSRIREIVADAVQFAPSAFHSQSARVILLFGEQHKQLWEIVLETLRARVPAEKFAPTEKKVGGFAAGYGSILYFEDQQTIAGLQQSFPGYAENFPIWSNQSAGMLQFAIWTALSQEGLGASLQHYNPLIDEAVAKAFGAPADWKLLAQMPFGTPGENTPDPLARKPIEERLKVLGGTL